jgi:AbiU2
MPALSHLIAIEFCKLCDWAYQVWINHRELFDDNPRGPELQKSLAADTLLRLSTISHEYTLLQIAKLHDHAVVAGQVTLGIEYILKYGGWDQPTQEKLNGIAAKLDTLAKDLRTVRNKILSHNDLAAVLSGAPLGEFKKDEDVQYFTALQEFVDVVHSSVVGGPYPFDDLVKNDVVAFLSVIKP